MNFRTAALTTALFLSATLLGGCTPTPTPTPAPLGDSPSSLPPKPVVTQEPEAPLPADAVLGISAHATADNGAEVKIHLVLLKPLPWDVATERATTTAAWCEGEVDNDVFMAESGFSFAELDVTVTPVAGTAAWPTDLPLHILPGGGGPTLAPAGGAYAVQKPDDSGSDDPGYYVPHCQQDAFLAVPGTGSVYLGWGNDGTTLDDWATSNYGATFDLFGEPTAPDRATLTDCAKVITELGTSMGGSDVSLPDFFSSTQCRVGSAA